MISPVRGSAPSPYVSGNYAASNYKTAGLGPCPYNDDDDDDDDE